MKKDIFDKIMCVSFLKWANPFYVKYKKVLLYLFFGFITFCINIVVFAGFNKVLGINELVSNVFAWIIAVSLAYITSKIWIFESTNMGIMPIIKEVFTFFAGRIGTLLVEEIILFIFITQLGMNSIGIKLISQIIVVILNYIISKVIVFK